MIKNEGIIFRYRLFWHFLFWLCCYLFYALTYGTYTNNYRAEFIGNLYILPVRMAGTYVFIYYLIPSLLLKRKYLAFSVFTVIHALLYGVFIWIVLYFYFYCPDCVYADTFNCYKITGVSGYISKIFNNIIGNYAITAIAALIKFFKQWHLDQQRKRLLERDILEAELKFLKSQINPHFLFNTLNNLYALTLKKSEKAPDIVIKLSNMLDYMLYNSNEEEVSLKNEIKLLKDYIELEKIRYGERLKLKFEITGKPEGKKIAPLILLPFIENAFKHGASQDISTPFIDIGISIQEDCLKLNVSNTLNKNEQHIENYTEGIGLKNVQRRLELQYPNSYSLKIDQEGNIFKVSLQIGWKAHLDNCK